MDKKALTERDICTKYITPAIIKSGWDIHKQVLEEVTFTNGKIIVRGKMIARGAKKRADYLLSYKPNIPIAVIEAKDNKHSIRSGIQQALEYAQILDVPFVFSSNGDGFLFHDKTASDENIETELDNDSFPSPEELWEKYKLYKGIITPESVSIVAQDYHFDGTGRKPRYYQQIAINRTIEAIAKGQNRILLVMATGTGKTYTAFQIAYRLWSARVKKRILFLADRNVLLDQAKRGDFKYFRNKMTVVKNRTVDKSYEVYLTLYQGITGNEEERNIFKQFSTDFFDLIIIDECHRGSAREDSAWHEILQYFKSATHIGLTATPKETKEVSNIEYFQEPIFTYSLRQGIEDGFLAPYKVIRVGLNIDLEGWRPEKNKKDKKGHLVEDRIYNTKDFDRTLVIDERTPVVAKKITEFLRGYDRFAKTIVFCVDIEHAERMRQALAVENSDLVSANYKYVMQITGDNEEGKRELDNFINPEEAYPVIATTSELMTTGIDATTCKLIVLDSNITSMTKFKQVIGRGTRIDEENGKMYFTILDFRNATSLFAEKSFDGDPIRIKEVDEGEDLGDIEDEPDTGCGEGESEGISDPPLPPTTPQPPLPPLPPTPPPRPREKVYVNGVDVSILITREIYFEKDGKLITKNLTDYTKDVIQGKYASLDEFINKWKSAEKKSAIIEELNQEGILVEALYEAVDKELDLFDLICHIAYDQPPLTRRERAENVKKRNYFGKYNEKSKKVLESLLEKYADEGIQDIESLEVLKLQPLNEMGSPLEILRNFGSKNAYMEAIKELEDELYKTA